MATDEGEEGEEGEEGGEGEEGEEGLEGGEGEEGLEKQCKWCLSTIWEFNGVTQSACGNTVSTDQQEEKHLRPRGCILNTNLKAPAVKRMGFRETNTI
jgi:hypothetical protein